jgi:hypothetical protein
MEKTYMQKNKKRLFWALILLLLFLPPCYYFRSSFVGQKAQLERERLLVRREISEPLQHTQGEGEEEIGPVPEEEGLTRLPAETSGEDAAGVEALGEEEEELSIPPTLVEEARRARLKELEARIGELERELSAKDKRIKDWKRRWEAKRKELERHKRELVALRKECVPKERKPLVGKPPERKKRARPEKPFGPPMELAKLAECEGVPMSHSNVALFFSQGLNLGSDLSYAQAAMALHGLGIFPGAGWNQGDPSFPIGADELEEVLVEVKNAISMGLAAADYSELANKLRHYCERERAQLVEVPQCEGPMVTECEKSEISQGEYAIYLCKVLGLGEGLNYDQSFLALGALRISPKRGWNFEDPTTLVTQREMEEVRCSVLAAHKKGLIETAPNLMVASINDYCLWLKMNVEVVGRGTVAEAVAQTDYQGGEGISIPRGGTVASTSQ